MKMGLDITHCNSDALFNPVPGYHHRVSACLVSGQGSIFFRGKIPHLYSVTSTRLGSSENKCLLPSTAELFVGLCIFTEPTKFEFTSS